jgi:hypothetical protein
MKPERQAGIDEKSVAAAGIRLKNMADMNLLNHRLGIEPFAIADTRTALPTSASS